MAEATLLIKTCGTDIYSFESSTKILYLFFLYSNRSVLGIISAIIRKAAFVIVLCSWFTVMNVIALWRLFL